MNLQPIMDHLEEGQIVQDQSTASGDFYDPELEWPGDDTSFGPVQDWDTNDSASASQNLRSGQPVFRLVVLHSSILPKKQKVAVIDAYLEVQIGRDIQPEGSTTPRIRLKEMEVSKFHATAYWDGARKEWHLVDMGSMHGTYLRSGPISSDSADSGTRLSQARAASMPRRLRHSDQLTVGGTTFEIHIHDNQRPCQRCTILGDEEIPMFPPSKKTAIKRTRDVAEIDSGTSASSNPLLAVDRNPKRALNTLKRSLLTRHDVSQQRPSTPNSPISVAKRPEYVDRAARRRLLHPASRPDTPGVSSLYPPAAQQTPPPLVATEESIPKPVVSAPPTPLPSSNIGHRLLLQQGWAPGNALGVSVDSSEGRVGLIDPLEVKSSQNRAGLGMKPPSIATEGLDSTPKGNWKDREKFKRFNTLR